MQKFTALLLSAIADLTLLASPAEAKPPTEPPTDFVPASSLELPGAEELSRHPVKGVAEYTVSASRETAEDRQSLGTTTGVTP